MESVVGRAFGIQSLLAGKNRREGAEPRDPGASSGPRHSSGLRTEHGRTEGGTL